MGELIFNLLVRRSGSGFHDSDKFTVHEFMDSHGKLDKEALKDAVCHYIDVQLEDEETNEDDGDDMWDEVKDEN